MKRGFKLSKKGEEIVNLARKKKGWNKNERAWIDLAFTSESTLKRFFKGERISMDTFKAISQVVGIEEWQQLVDWEDDDNNLALPLSETSPPQLLEISQAQTTLPGVKKGLIAITGIFDESKYQEIQVALENLQQLLAKHNVTIQLASNLGND